MLRTLRPLLLILAVAWTVPMHARAGDRDGDSERENAGDRVRQVERDGGRVLQAEPMQRSGREVYRLKVLTPEGRVRVLDDSRRREAPPENTERRRDGGAEARRELPEIDRADRQRQDSGRGDEGRRRPRNP